MRTPKEQEAYERGRDAVRARPKQAPSNPYDTWEETYLSNAWNDGACDAGINELYTNGTLNR